MRYVLLAIGTALVSGLAVSLELDHGGSGKSPRAGREPGVDGAAEVRFSKFKKGLGRYQAQSSSAYGPRQGSRRLDQSSEFSRNGETTAAAMFSGTLHYLIAISI